MRHRTPLAALALVAALAMSGCATLGRAPVSLQAPLLVVAEGEEQAEAEARETRAVRALSVVPVRAWPSDAEPDLAAALGGDPAGRLERAREAAEDRRLPWLLVLEKEGARLETTRGGAVLWTWRGRSDAAEAQVASALGRAMRRRSPRPHTLGEPRLAPAERLHELRSLAARSKWSEYIGGLTALADEFPADPAVRTHAALRRHLAAEEGDLPELDLARKLAPEAESELLAVALVAEAAGNPGLAGRARQALVHLHPDRLDYRTGLADDLALLDQPDEALRACRGGLAEGDRDTILDVEKGTAPHDAPAALPYADLAFCVGYWLFERQEWEMAALSYEDAIAVYEALGRWRELGEALNNAGVAMVQAERPLIGARTLRRAVDVREELGDLLPLANSRYNLGRALSDAGKTDEAMISLHAAADDYRAADDRMEALSTLVDTIELHVEEGDREGMEEKARGILEESSDSEETLEAEEVSGNTWYELGRGRFSLGDAEGSIAAYIRSLRAWQSLGWKLEEGQTHYSMALPHLAMFDFDEAWTDLIRALEISVELSDSSSILAIREQLYEIGDLIEQAGREPPPVPEALKRWLRDPPR